MSMLSGLFRQLREKGAFSPDMPRQPSAEPRQVTVNRVIKGGNDDLELKRKELAKMLAQRMPRS